MLTENTRVVTEWPTNLFILLSPLTLLSINSSPCHNSATKLKPIFESEATSDGTHQREPLFNRLEFQTLPT